MNNKKAIVFLSIVITILLLLILIIYNRQKPVINESTIGSIAYNYNKIEYIVYIKESSDYVPYLVLDNNKREL